MTESDAATATDPFVQELLERLRLAEAHYAQGGDRPLDILPWEARYESGLALIDGEHRELFVLANSVLAAALGRDRQPKPFQSALDALFVHIARHFTDEERVLEQFRYEHLEAHKRAHKALLARAQELELRAEAGQITLRELADFLALDVVANHLLKSDKLYFGLFRDPA